MTETMMAKFGNSTRPRLRWLLQIAAHLASGSEFYQEAVIEAQCDEVKLEQLIREMLCNNLKDGKSDSKDDSKSEKSEKLAELTSQGSPHFLIIEDDVSGLQQRVNVELQKGYVFHGGCVVVADRVGVLRQCLIRDYRR
jgi:hypothetical protein